MEATVDQESKALTGDRMKQCLISNLPTNIMEEGISAAL